MREFLVSYRGTEPPPTGGERPQAAQLLPACHMPTARILDLWEDHTMLKRQPRHQARLGGHQQLPLSLLVRQDQGDVHGKARPTEITSQGYKGGGLATTNPPSSPITDHPRRYPRAPGPPASLFVRCNQRRSPVGWGAVPSTAPRSPHMGQPGWGFPPGAAAGAGATAHRLAGALTAVTSPAWRRRGGPHCLCRGRAPRQ